MLRHSEIHLKPGCQHRQHRARTQAEEPQQVSQIWNSLGFGAPSHPQRSPHSHGEPHVLPCGFWCHQGPSNPFTAFQSFESLCFPRLWVCFCVPLMAREEERQEGEPSPAQTEPLGRIWVPLELLCFFCSALRGPDVIFLGCPSAPKLICPGNLGFGVLRVSVPAHSRGWGSTQNLFLQCLCGKAKGKLSQSSSTAFHFCALDVF